MKILYFGFKPDELLGERRKFFDYLVKILCPTHRSSEV